MKKCVLTVLVLCVWLLCGCRFFVGPGGTPAASAAPARSSPPAVSAAPSGRTASQDTAGAATTLPEGLTSVKPESDETPAPTVTSATGEIPETQKFVTYSSTAGGYDIQAPEGWTSAADGGNIKYTHKHSGVQVEVFESTEPFTVEAIGSSRVSELVRRGRAVDVKHMAMVTTLSGQAVLVEYESNSAPDADGRKVRLDNKRYYFYKDGKLAALTLWAPLGVDNENIWKQLPDTFFWRE